MGATEMHRLDRQQAIELTAEVQGLDLYRTMQLVQPVLTSIPLPPGYEIRFGQNIKELERKPPGNSFGSDSGPFAGIYDYGSLVRILSGSNGNFVFSSICGRGRWSRLYS